MQTRSSRKPKPANLEVTSLDVEQGKVLWIPPHQNVKNSVIQINTGEEMEPKQYDHPIIVLSRPANNPETMYFICVTSFHSRTLSEAIPEKGKGPRKREHYIPITTAPQHPFYVSGNRTYQNLLLSEGGMKTDCYANAKKVFRMHWREAERYWGANRIRRVSCKLDQESFSRLLALAASLSGVSPGVQYEAQIHASNASVPSSESLIQTPTPDLNVSAPHQDLRLLAETATLSGTDRMAAQQEWAANTKRQALASERHIVPERQASIFPQHRPNIEDAAARYIYASSYESGNGPHRVQDVLGETRPLLPNGASISDSGSPPKGHSSWLCLWQCLVFVPMTVGRFLQHLAKLFRIWRS